MDENVKADQAARLVTQEGNLPERELHILKTIALKEAVAELGQRRYQKLAPVVGRFTQNFDQALPEKHARKLYDSLSRGQVAVLSQLRTRKNKLNYYLAKAKIIESEVCECKRESETASQFLVSTEVPPLIERANTNVKRSGKTQWRPIRPTWRVGSSSMLGQKGNGNLIWLP